MSDIYFPDIGNALLKGSQARLASNEIERQRRIKEAGPDVQAAVGGDAAALGRVAAIDPDYALKIGPILERMDAQQRAKAKAAADYTYSAANAILQADPKDRPAVYKQLLTQGQSQGFDLKHLPQEYTPQLDPHLRTLRQMSIPVLEQWKVEQDRPQPMPSVTGQGQAPAGWPGTAPAAPPATVAPDALPKGQQLVQYLTGKGLSPVAAAGVAGNLYQESAFKPTAVGDGGTAYGQGQWRNDRAVALGQFAQTQGKPPTDPQVQVDFLLHEMQNGDAGARQAFQMLQQAKTPDQAVEAMMHFFRPKGYTPQNPRGGDAFAQRVQYSQQFMPQAVGAGASPSPQGAPPPGGAAPGQSSSAPEWQREFDDIRRHIPAGWQAFGSRKLGPAYDKEGRLRIVNPQTGEETSIEIPKKADDFEDVKGPNGQLIGQRNRRTNQYHPINQVAASGIPQELANAHGEDFVNSPFWQGKDPATRSVVQGLLDGSLPLSALPKRAGSGNAAVGGENVMTYMAYAKQIDPSWSPNEGAQRQRFETQFMVNGQGGQTIIAANTAINHMRTFHDLMGALNNGDVKIVNTALNEIRRQFGDAAASNPEAAKAVLASEIAKAVRGAGAINEQEQKDYQKILSTAQSPAQTAGTLKTLTELMMGRIQALQDTAKANGVPESKYKDYISARSRESLEYMAKDQAKPTEGNAPPKIGANGEGYDQIKPGQQYIAPDGTTRTKGGR